MRIVITENGFETDPEVLRLEDVISKVNLILQNQEKMMIDLKALQDVVSRLEASDTAELALLQSVKDENTTMAAQLANVTSTDPATQATIDAIVKRLTDTADKVDAAVTANTATPNLAPTTPAVGTQAPTTLTGTNP